MDYYILHSEFTFWEERNYQLNLGSSKKPIFFQLSATNTNIIVKLANNYTHAVKQDVKGIGAVKQDIKFSQDLQPQETNKHRQAILSFATAKTTHGS